MVEKKELINCFFVTPIGGDGSTERKRADDLLLHILRPIAKNFLNIARADEIDEPGTITTDIVQRLYNNDLVIADLTGHNPNVMYEIGLRHCFNLPIVHIAQSGEKPPFDLAAERIIFFDINDIRSIETAKRKIMASSKAALEAKPFRSPVVRALELESIFAASNEMPMSRDLIEKLDAIETMLDDVSAEVQSAAFFNDLGTHIELPEVDTRLVDRVEELVRLFDRVGPADIARLADMIKSK